MVESGAALKTQVKEHWENEACGTRYGQKSDRKKYFDEVSAARYKLESYILSFAKFPNAKGLRMLEIGVGAGADFQNWCKYAVHATGVDLTETAINLTRERLELNSISEERYTLRQADSENLPFEDDSFDFVYSWGVLHHTPNTIRAFEEVCRVLKPGGTIKAMVYHDPSWTGFLLYLQHGLLRGNFRMTQKQAMFSHLESPGTKSYTVPETEEFLNKIGFSNIKLFTKLGLGDLLTIKPSAKYNSPLFKVIWRLYPRWLVRLIGDRYGLNLCIEASKPLRKS